jgi:hypothetical protein
VELLPIPTLACTALLTALHWPYSESVPLHLPNPTTSSLKRTLTIPSPVRSDPTLPQSSRLVKPNTISPLHQSSWPIHSDYTTHLSVLFPLHPTTILHHQRLSSLLNPTAALRSSPCFLSISRSLAPFRPAGVLDLLLSIGLKFFLAQKQPGKL